MTDKRAWTMEEDRLLQYVFETSKLTKWSHIAKKLQEEYGLKGRNGKQCKERYTTHIDTSHPKEEWSFDDEQRMFDLHNELGNKWAIIGSKLGGRTDNCVKNHFYSRLRKALRKMNRVIHDHYRKEIKEIKPNVLYRIIEVAEENFKLIPCFEKDFSLFSNHLKNELLEFSYDDEVEEANELKNINVDSAKELIDKISEFGINYKKKAKKDRKVFAQTQDQNLLTPHRYHQRTKKCNSENEESEGSSSFVHSSETSNVEDISDDEVNRSIREKKHRNNSFDGSMEEISGIRTRARSHGNVRHSSLEVNNINEMKDEKQQQNSRNNNQGTGLQVILDGLQILEQDNNVPPHPLLMKKETSKYSRFSQNIYDNENFHHFFEDSQIEMRILLPEMQMGLHRESQIEDNLFNSC